MKKTVFWSWQSDLPQAVTREFIKQALAQALKKVNEELELETARRIELDHDTKGEAGLVEIVATIFKKIDECEVFVADITPVAATTLNGAEKKIPNPNVMIELGYALRELGHQRIITVVNLAYGGNPEELPFDLRHRRGAITYTLESTDDMALDKERKALVENLTAALRINLNVPREDRMIRNPIPAMSLELGDAVPKVSLIQQNASLDGVPSLADIMVQTPVQSKVGNSNTRHSTPFGDLEFFDPLSLSSRQRVKPFKEWTLEELNGYNKRVQQYYEKYEIYLKELMEHKLYLQRSIVVELVMANRGTLPASDVRSRISFPPGIFAYEHDELPSPPVLPEPPPFAPHGINNTISVVSTNPSFDLTIEKYRRIADDRRSIELHQPKIQHKYQVAFRSFTLLLSSEEDIASFDAEYSITADELPLPKEEKMHFDVKRADS